MLKLIKFLKNIHQLFVVLKGFRHLWYELELVIQHLKQFLIPAVQLKVI